jgi:hypothetical protein
MIVFIKKIFAEPFIHFLLIAALLFFLENIYESYNKDEIVVDKPTAKFLIDKTQSLVLYPLSQNEKESIINSYVEDETLLREAYKLGLNKDPRIRIELIRKMRALELADINDQPSDQELRQFFSMNQKRYATSNFI